MHVSTKPQVSQASAVHELMVTAAGLGGGSIESLVNVAGVDIIAKVNTRHSCPPSPIMSDSDYMVAAGALQLEDTTLERWERTLSVNLTSMFLTCSAGLPFLKNAGCVSTMIHDACTMHEGGMLPVYPSWPLARVHALCMHD